ncbi:MAG: hypothetical protein Kow00121_67330 [Elainellaceae cyanobacterium]
MAMNELTLEWVEANQVKTQIIADRQPTKVPGLFRIGRDPVRCDLVLQHPTVSKLHVEIFFSSQQNTFYLRNLRDTNPPVVDQHRVTQATVPLRQGSTILLGELEVRVKAIALVSAIAAPVVAAPAVVSYAAGRAPVPPQPGVVQSASQPAINLSYGLQCPKCHRASPYHHLEVGCAWCGTSLAAAHSVLLVPD